jgi:hypothetical protein
VSKVSFSSDRGAERHSRAVHSGVGVERGRAGMGGKGAFMDGRRLLWYRECVFL